MIWHPQDSGLRSGDYLAEPCVRGWNLWLYSGRKQCRLGRELTRAQALEIAEAHQGREQVEQAMGM